MWVGFWNWFMRYGIHGPHDRDDFLLAVVGEDLSDGSQYSLGHFLSRSDPRTNLMSLGLFHPSPFIVANSPGEGRNVRRTGTEADRAWRALWSYWMRWIVLRIMGSC